MPDSAIIVEGLSKRYRIGTKEKSSDTFGGAMTKWLKTPFSNLKKLKDLIRFETSSSEALDVIWALKDVSFKVKQGEVIGIIGRNGAGKSTLLKILSRITEPTSGRALINGRVSSLLEVGTGFHQELTGRENVYLNGTILGMSKKEIDRKFDEIVAFSEVEAFLDTPVKRYSSGMKVRLAFAVAAHLEPEILLIDEVLAVGDASFQKKCLGKMGAVATEGRTVLFVSHNMGAVQQLCKRCFLFKSGSLSVVGESNDVIEKYIRDASNQDSNLPERWVRSGSGRVRIRSIELLNDQNHECKTFFMGQNVRVKISGNSAEPNLSFTVGLQIVTQTEISVIYAYDQFKEFQTTDENIFSFQANIPNVQLMPGLYYLNIWIGRSGLEEFDYVKYVAPFTVLQSDKINITQTINQREHGLTYGELITIEEDYSDIP
ncbi:MAG: ABC transporter ATP-binding protein [Thermodesulfobacteriota bacterium]